MNMDQMSCAEDQSPRVEIETDSGSTPPLAQEQKHEISLTVRESSDTNSVREEFESQAEGPVKPFKLKIPQTYSAGSSNVLGRNELTSGVSPDAETEQEQMREIFDMIDKQRELLTSKIAKYQAVDGSGDQAHCIDTRDMTGWQSSDLLRKSPATGAMEDVFEQMLHFSQLKVSELEEQDRIFEKLQAELKEKDRVIEAELEEDHLIQKFQAKLEKKDRIIQKLKKKLTIKNSPSTSASASTSARLRTNQSTPEPTDYCVYISEN